MATPIDEFLATLKGRRIRYYANPGNGGDSLIALGAYQLFARHGLDYTFVDERTPPETLAGEVVVVAGGGALIRNYVHCRRFIEPIHALVERLIIMPHTIAGHADLLTALGSNVDVICRERMSHEFVSTHAGACSVHLMDDLAFSLDVDAVMRGWPRLRMPNVKEAGRLARHLVRLATLPKPRDPDIYNCFRTDSERTDMVTPADNIDLPTRVVLGTRPEICAHIGVREIFRILRRYGTVNTNRLHIGVAGALLGLNVNFYDNNYGKNAAVYEFSMRDRFPNVVWKGRPEGVLEDTAA